MRLHTNLDISAMYDCLFAVKDKGKMTEDVYFTVLDIYGSRSHARAFEVQLGTHDKYSLPAGTVDQYGKAMRVRRFKNSGQYGADSVWSATYFEWGWLMAEIYRLDPRARWGKTYLDSDDFHCKTVYRFQ